MNGRRIHTAKYFADISKLILGGGVIARIYSPEILDWSGLIGASVLAISVFIGSWLLHPRD